MHGGVPERQIEIWKRSISLGAVRGEPGGGSFTGDPEDYVEEGSGDEHLSIASPLENMDGARIPGTV
jgi:hypothetical protein